MATGKIVCISRCWCMRIGKYLQFSKMRPEARSMAAQQQSRVVGWILQIHERTRALISICSCTVVVVVVAVVFLCMFTINASGTCKMTPIKFCCLYICCSSYLFLFITFKEHCRCRCILLWIDNWTSNCIHLRLIYKHVIIGSPSGLQLIYPMLGLKCQ